MWLWASDMANHWLERDSKLPDLPLAQAMLNLAQARGLNLHKWLRGSGLFPEDFGHKSISPEQLLLLIERLYKLLPGQDHSFVLGHQLAQHGFTLGKFALSSCPSQPLVYTQLQQYQGQWHGYFEDAIGCGAMWPVVLEIHLTAILAYAKLNSGQRLKIALACRHDRPRHIQDYEHYLGLQLQFQQPLDQVRFINADAIGFEQLFVSDSAHQQAKSGLLAWLQQQLEQQSDLRLEQLAHQLEISPATLKRKLKQHGSAYSKLQDKVNGRRAIQLLQQGCLTNELLAQQLGFADIANFRRAFKRWLGDTPQMFRAKYSAE